MEPKPGKSYADQAREARAPVDDLEFGPVERNLPGRSHERGVRAHRSVEEMTVLLLIIGAILASFLIIPAVYGVALLGLSQPLARPAEAEEPTIGRPAPRA